MKLTHSQLLHATNKQLAAVGLRRNGNRGWMEKALQREFSADELLAFNEAKIGIPTQPTYREPWRMEITGPDGTRRIIECASRAALYDEMRRVIST